MNNLLTQFPGLENPVRILTYFIAALLVAFLFKTIGARVGQARSAGSARWSESSPEPQKTLQSLIASAINLFVFIIAIMASVTLFVDPNTLAWVVGLLGTAVGFGARLIVGDYLSGLSFLFEDTFSVGDKIEIHGPPTIEGVVETINLRTTLLRSSSGELYILPNGEIRTVRNFSRGQVPQLPISRSRSRVPI